MSSNTVIKFMFRDDFKVFNDALNFYPHYEVADVSSGNDLATLLSTVPAGLVIASLKDKNDLIQIATFLKISRKIAKDTVVKLVVINFCTDKQYEKAMAKLGVQDLIEPGVTTKALKFKIDFWMKSLNVQVRNNANATAQKTVKAAENLKASDKKNESPGLSWLEPLDLENDIWIMKQDNDCKKVLSKWLIRLMGPSPYVGQWVEVKTSHWRFDFKENDKELFISGNGSWFFQGEQRPEFIWKENTWLITGNSFELYFKDDTKVFSRIKSKEKNLTICKNSLFAATKESLIIESFDKELIFKREKEHLDDLEGKNKTENIDGRPLSGKNKTENIDDGPLSGKNKTEQIDDGPLSGKNKTENIDDGPLSGKNKTENIDGGPLAGKNKSSENINGNLSGKTQGEQAIKKENLVQKTETEKSSTSRSGKNTNAPVENDGISGPKSDGPRSGSNLERERNDLDYLKNYKNHNETQEYKPFEAKERERKTLDEKSSGKGHLSGKSNTDSLEKNYDNSKTEREKKEIEAKEKELAGKSSTDKLDSHYGNPKDVKNPTKKNEEEKEKEEKTKEFASKQRVQREKVEAVERDKKEKEDREINERTNATLDKIQAKERERKEKQEQLNKERTETSQKNVALSDEKEKFKDVIAEKEHKGKSTPFKGQEVEHDLGMKGESSTDKLDAHYKNKNEPQKRKEREEAADSYTELFGKGQTRSVTLPKEKPVVELADENANVLPLNKAKEDKEPKNPDEIELEELTKDSKVLSFLTQNNKKFSVQLDDFFDEMIIFKTLDSGIEPSGKVSLDIIFQFLEKESKILMQGEIIEFEVEGNGNGTSFVTVKLNKENTNSFNIFMRLYEKRQSNVYEFLKKVKGI